MAKLKQTRRRLDRQSRERRERLRGLWSDARWWIILALFATALVLGFIGFRDYQAEVGGPTGFWDVLYRDLQLYVFESGALEDASAIPFSLQIARFLAPLVTLVFLDQAVGSLVRDQFHIARLGRSSGHVVVCGLGNRGLELARNLRRDGYPVVAIERDGDHAHVEACRSAGVPVLVGDATQPAMLRRAGTGRAGAVVALCGDDAVNAKIAAAAQPLATDGEEPLVGFVHVFEPRLCSLLRARHLAISNAPAFRLEFINTFERGAKEVLLRHSPFSDPDSSEAATRPHLLVVGLGWFGESLVVHAARTWQLAHQGALGPLPVTVVDVNAESEVASLLLRHPEVESMCDLHRVPLDVRTPEFEKGEFLDALEGGPITAAYVCLDDDVLSLETALHLHNQLRGSGIPIVMRAGTEDGLPALLGQRASDEYEDLHAFALVERTCDPELILRDTDEILARALHDVFVQAREEQGWRYGPERDDARKINPALAPWNELDEEYRDSNRNQAAHTGVKLRAVGCEIDEMSEWQDQLFAFTDDEVELLAEMEHQRFVDNRVSHGWTFGPNNPERKQSEYLVPWEELADRDHIREYDREFVRGLPMILAKLGFRIVRVTSEPQVRVA